MQIIGICGRAQSGKTTLSRFIGETNLPFAKFLKDALIAMGMPEEWAYNPEEKAKPKELLGGKTPRWAMQALGTEWGREMIHPDIWVRFWLKRAQELAAQNPEVVIVVDDVRFSNEIEALQKLGALLVAVSRCPPERRMPERLLHWLVGARKAHRILTMRQHASERLRFEDHGIPIIYNDGTPEELYQKFLQLERAYLQLERARLRGVNDTASGT